MRVEGLDLPDTKGARRCPSCGERHLQKVHSYVTGCWRPDVVECPACRHVWRWPTPAEDELARKEAQRKRSREFYLAHRDEILAREHKYKDHLTAQARERRHRKRAHLHPVRVCPTCGTRFVAKSLAHRFCSDRCWSNAPDRKRKRSKEKDAYRRRRAAYLAALESVAESVGRLDECRKALEVG